MDKFKFDTFLSGVDSVMIIDANFNVLHAMRIGLHKKILPGSSESHDIYIGKNLFDIYPTISPAESSYTEAMQTGQPSFRYNQRYEDCFGVVYYTNNLTIPLIDRGKITGFVGLSKDITSIDHILTEEALLSDEISSIPRLKTRIESTTFDDIITNNKEMEESIRLARKLVSFKNPILVYGETGTGKELIVQAIINYSNISRKKVITQNCAAIPDNLIESILFGTVKGSFTGSENKDGLFDLAQDGILYLDELNSLPYHVQGNLLRVLQDGSYRPVGSYTQKKTNAKVIAAMNINPLKAIEDKLLRKDLFYRFSSSIISIPPLRDRKEDIPLYLRAFIAQSCLDTGKVIHSITPDLKQVLLDYTYDGNVRELKHIVNFMVDDTENGILTIKNLPAYMQEFITKIKSPSTMITPDIGLSPKDFQPDANTLSNYINTETLDLSKILEDTEKSAIKEALRRSNGNVTDAAILLHLSRQSLAYKLNKYSIDRKNYKLRKI